MQIIIGLGNPGVPYAGTRHNAGMMLVDKLSDYLPALLGKALQAGGWRKHYDALIYQTPDLVLVKTKDVFMNESGRLLQGLPGGELYVAHDDLDLKLGKYKIQRGVGPKLHYGVQSIEGVVGDKDFWHIRIGIDNRTTLIEGEAYVLQKFTPGEKVILENTLDAIIKTINTSQKPSR